MPPKKKLCAPSWQPKLPISRIVTSPIIDSNSEKNDIKSTDLPQNNTTQPQTDSSTSRSTPSTTTKSTNKVDKFQPKWVQLHPWLQYDPEKKQNVLQDLH